MRPNEKAIRNRMAYSLSMRQWLAILISETHPITRTVLPSLQLLSVAVLCPPLDGGKISFPFGIRNCSFRRVRQPALRAPAPLKEVARDHWVAYATIRPGSPLRPSSTFQGFAHDLPLFYVSDTSTIYRLRMQRFQCRRLRRMLTSESRPRIWYQSRKHLCLPETF